MKVLIVGRTGRGKDKLREILEKRYGWKFVLSATTRAKRYESEDTHIFMTKEEADAIPDEDKVAVTFIENEKKGEKDEYFATRQQVEEADAYIIDPVGVKQLLENMPEEVFEICYLHSPKEEARKMAISRANGDELQGLVFDKRSEDEDEQFNKFEASIESGNFGSNMCRQCGKFYNDYTEECLALMAEKLEKRRKLYQLMIPMVKTLKEHHVFHLDEKNQVLICQQKANDSDQYGYVSYTDEGVACCLLSDPVGFSACMQEWLLVQEKLHDPNYVPDTYVANDYTFAFDTETALGEPRTWIDLSDGTRMEIIHEEDGLETPFYSIQLHCNEEDFDNDVYHQTCGVIEHHVADHMDELIEILNTMLKRLEKRGITVNE